MVFTNRHFFLPLVTLPNSFHSHLRQFHRSKEEKCHLHLHCLLNKRTPPAFLNISNLRALLVDYIPA